jgi:hypothetical protein
VSGTVIIDENGARDAIDPSVTTPVELSHPELAALLRLMPLTRSGSPADALLLKLKQAQRRIYDPWNPAHDRRPRVTDLDEIGK